MSFRTKLFSGLRRIAYRMFTIFDRVFRIPEPRVVVFAYHSIAEDSWRYSIDRASFEQQITRLLRKRKPRSLSELARHISGEAPFTEPSFVLCFDDGYRDILDVFDFLRDSGVTPSVFPLADRAHADTSELGTDRAFLGTEELRFLAKSGWEIGCHSATHRDMWALSSKQVAQETVGAKRMLESEVGVPIRFFAYPRGRSTKVVRRALRDAGFLLALSMDDGFVEPGIDPFRVPRVGVDRTHTVSECETLFSTSAIVFRATVKRWLPSWF
ncbi:MAG: polysaccharide deacetylase family protein [Candidatus Moraniibacteriota bacterium]|nr:MAG: polysaccharide deacetylase family protein [Candidatus Moranbacteria bacterium]